MWIAPKAALPHAIAQHNDRWRAFLVIGRRQAATDGNRRFKHAEVVAGDQLAQQSRRSLRITLAMDQQRRQSRLKRGQRALEALRVIAQLLVELVREHAPVAQKLAGDAVAAVAPYLI